MELVAFTVTMSLLFFSLSSTLISAVIIMPGSTLYASNQTQTWTSPNKAFSLRFISDGSAHFAAITYYGISLWKASGAADSSASLQFLPNGNFRLVNGSSGSVVWESNTPGLGVSSASLDDSGNFALLNGAVSVWSTFENPTDTILPSQNLTIRKVLRSGLYSFTLLRSGNLELKWNYSILYWNLGLNSSFNSINLTSPSLILQSNGALFLFDPSISSPVVMAYSSDYDEGSDILRFLRLDSDGNLRIYSSVKGSGKITERWAAVSDQCLVFGYCGDMGICSYNDSGPICGCLPQYFDPIDPTDSRKGCKRRVLDNNDCPGRETMLQLDHTKFLTYPPELSPQLFTVGISACRLNCLYSPSCIASTTLSDGKGNIYMKFPGFVSAYKSPALPTTSFVKVCGPVISNPKSNARGLKGGVITVVVIGTILGFTMFQGSLLFWLYGNRPKFGGVSVQYSLLNYFSGAPLQVSYKELKSATKGFTDKLGGGGGGFGALFKGTLADGTVVAVKQLEGIEKGEKQFRMEVSCICGTHHFNLVRLIGYCCEGRRHRLLAYEFMKNRSLDHFLFPREEQYSGKSLNWECRVNVALGTARGITYLHEECRDCILHCNIKPENILLDEKYNAKVSDFGLVQLTSPKRDHWYRTLTSIRGTRRWYLAPEWLVNLPITSKVDVYSYGMVLLEVVSGRRNFEVSAETNHKKFSVWAYEEFEKGNVKGIVDRRLGDHELDMEQVMRAIQVSFWCIQKQPNQRPMMGKVVQMLEGVIEIEKPPNPEVGAKGSFKETIVTVNGKGAIVASSTASSSSSSFHTAQTLSFV